jgi:subtilase family serine protease
MKINQRGETGNYPQQDFGWGVEASLDLQMISTACSTCKIVLVEANSPTDRAFFRAEQAAVDAGATVTNHSFGRLELTGAETDALAFEHPGVTAVASTGDFGYGPASFPASSPHVIAVGGTTLSRSTTDPRGWSEKAWRFAGSGCSAYFAKPVGQVDTACHGRTIADVSAVAKGLAVYNTSLPRRFRGWLRLDGTSASSPLIAGMLASIGVTGTYQPSLLYGLSDGFNDVVGGSNGYCLGSYLCTGVAGYDGPTGIGTPQSPVSFSTG